MFVYDTDYLIEEANYVADMEKIMYTADAMFDTFVESMFDSYEAQDIETYCEASESGGNTILTVIASIFRKIKEAILKGAQKIKSLFENGKLRALMSPETKELLKRAKKGEKITGPDVGKMAKIVNKSQSFIEKYAATVAGMLDDIDVSSHKSAMKAVEEVIHYHNNAMKQYTKLSDQLKSVSEKKVALTADKIYQFAKEGVDVGRSQEKFAKQMNQIELTMTNTVRSIMKSSQGVLSPRKVKKMMKESVEYDVDVFIVESCINAGYVDEVEFMESMEDDELETYLEKKNDLEDYDAPEKKANVFKRAASSIKSAVTKVCRSIGDFVSKHKAMVAAVITALAVIGTSVGVGVKIHGKKQAKLAASSQSTALVPVSGSGSGLKPDQYRDVETGEVGTVDVLDANGKRISAKVMDDGKRKKVMSLHADKSAGAKVMDDGKRKKVMSLRADKSAGAKLLGTTKSQDTIYANGSSRLAIGTKKNDDVIYGTDTRAGQKLIGTSKKDDDFDMPIGTMDDYDKVLSDVVDSRIGYAKVQGKQKGILDKGRVKGAKTNRKLKRSYYARVGK